MAIVPVKPNIQRISYGWDRMNDVAAKVAGFASASNQPQRLDRSSLPHGAAFGMIWPVASRGGLMPFFGPPEVADVPFDLEEIPRIQKFNSAKRRRISLFHNPRQDENTDTQEFNDSVTFHWKSMIPRWHRRSRGSVPRGFRRWDTRSRSGFEVRAGVSVPCERRVRCGRGAAH